MGPIEFSEFNKWALDWQIPEQLIKDFKNNVKVIYN